MTEKELLARAAKYCARQETSEFDIHRKLENWGASDEQIKKIIEQLIELDFINPARYARAFANDKLRFNSWGRIKIAYQLRQKKIPQEDIQNALDEIDEELYLQILKKLLTKKLQTIKKEQDSRKLRQKLVQYAASKGFEYDLIEKVLNEILKG